MATARSSTSASARRSTASSCCAASASNPSRSATSASPPTRPRGSRSASDLYETLPSEHQNEEGVGCRESGVGRNNESFLRHPTPDTPHPRDNETYESRHYSRRLVADAALMHELQRVSESKDRRAVEGLGSGHRRVPESAGRRSIELALPDQSVARETGSVAPPLSERQVAARLGAQRARRGSGPAHAARRYGTGAGHPPRSDEPVRRGRIRKSRQFPARSSAGQSARLDRRAEAARQSEYHQVRSAAAQPDLRSADHALISA